MGLIVDEGSQPYLNHHLLQSSLSSQKFEIVCIIVQQVQNNSQHRLVRRVYRKILQLGFWSAVSRYTFAIIDYLETLVVRRDPDLKPVLEKYQLNTFSIEQLNIKPVASKSGFVLNYRDQDIDAIKKLKLDVLVRGGSGILKGEVLQICKYGIISFHHGDNNLFRGGPPGFWEVFRQAPSTGFIIQRLTNELDGGDVLLEGCIPTARFYRENMCRVYLKSAVFLTQILEHLAEEKNSMKIVPKLPYAYPIYSIPTLRIQGLYLFKVVQLIFRALKRRLTNECYRWGIAYLFTEDWQSAVLRKAKVIENPPFRFLADPFLVTRENLTYLFCEDYDFRKSKGSISVYKIDKIGYQYLGIALEENFHLSYPFIFQVDNSIFMIPESHEAGQIRLYECIDFPLKWCLRRVLMDNVIAVDSSIFQYEDKWWLLTNLDSSNMNEFSSELHLFYSDSFDSSEWKAHSFNPVLFNSNSARNGGLMISNDEVLRVFQRQDFGFYGRSIGISKIVEVSATTYKEQHICDIGPHFFPKLQGTHHLSYVSGILALDFVKSEKM